MSSYNGQQGQGSTSTYSPPMDIHRRPSYLEITERPRNDDFDTRVICNLGSRFEEEEDEEAPEAIKTYLRIRPYMKRSEDEDDILEIKDDKTVVASYQAGGQGMKTKKLLRKMEFKFSKVLDGNCSQEHVFDQSISPLLDRFENGENCLVFSYGATNSGKTYTMRGSAKKYGIIPRTLDRIFTRFQDRIYKGGDIQPFRHESTRALQEDQQKVLFDRKKLLISAANETSEMKQRLTMTANQFLVSKISDTSSHCLSLRYAGGAPVVASDIKSLDGTVHLFGMWISFIELYNERCYDLLGGSGKRVEVKIVSEKGGYAYLKDVTELPVFSDEEAYALYVAGYKKLEVGATQANQTSSRSHCFFTIRVVELGVTASNTVFPISVHRITFCDLAGCERICQTENTGGQLKESANINQSLLSLLKVIRMIRDKQANGYSKQSFLEKIPFRDSKLTRIFQGYFTTSTHIAMIVNINPSPKMAESSMQTLMNSAIASNVVVYRPKPPPNVVVQDVLHNSSFLHSSLDLEDLMEQTEEEEESESESVNNCSAASSTVSDRPRQQKFVPFKIMESIDAHTPIRILKDKNTCASSEQTIKAKSKIRPKDEDENKENFENANSGPSHDYYAFCSAAVAENENLKSIISQLRDELISKEQEVQTLRAKVRTIEAETREAMMKKMIQINPSYLDCRNQRQMSSELRPSQFRSRLGLHKTTTTQETQTDENVSCTSTSALELLTEDED